MTLQTEFEFTLPRGFVDAAGRTHRDGCMRLATALDEIESTQAPQVQSNESFLPIYLLSRVIIRLGDLTAVTPQIVGNFFASDLLYLEEFYQRINQEEPMIIRAACPNCGTSFHVQIASPEQGEVQ